MRLIDADALIPMMKYATTDSEIGVFPIKIGFNEIEKVINEQPTIEPERKTGRWIEYDNSHCECPFCHVEWSYFDNEVECFNFCPNCGERMEGTE